MSKTATKAQLKLLVSIMERRPDIARNFHKGDKEDLSRFWQNAEVELNASGPPMKTLAEWKKVWIDQKKYVRRKASANEKSRKGTGGGPNKQQAFSDIEEAIFNLVSLKDYVEGVEAKKIGLPTPKKATLKKEVHEEELPTEYLEDATPGDNAAMPSNTPTLLPQAACEPPGSSRKQKARSATDALEAELSIQREILSQISLAVTSIREQKEAKEMHFEVIENLKMEEIDEMRRHNAAMEEFLAHLKRE